MTMEIIFLGTGGAWGVPELHCDCLICQEMRRRGEKRERTSILISGKTNLLLDCGPDIRSQLSRNGIENIDALWEMIAAGEVDNVASDLCPFDREQKEIDDIWEVPAGAPGIQTLVPLLIGQGVNKDRITLPQLVWVIAEGPARLCGLYPRKGACNVGSDADLIIADLNNEYPIEDDVLIGSEWTPFTGITACFPEHTLVRGTTVYADGQITGERGYGKFVKRLK